MSAATIVALASFVSVGALVLLVASLMHRRPAAVRRRLQDHAVTVVVSEAHRQERIRVLKARGIEDAMGGNSRLSRSKMVRTAAKELARAGLAITVRRYLVLRIAFALMVAVVAQIVLSNLLIARK